jgi:hypothetical protein
MKSNRTSQFVELAAPHQQIQRPLPRKRASLQEKPDQKPRLRLAKRRKLHAKSERATLKLVKTAKLETMIERTTATAMTTEEAADAIVAIDTAIATADADTAMKNQSQRSRKMTFLSR